MKDRRQRLWESFPFFHLAEVPASELGSLGVAAFTCRALLLGWFLNEKQTQGQGHFALWLGTEGSGKPGNSLPEVVTITSSPQAPGPVDSAYSKSGHLLSGRSQAWPVWQGAGAGRSPFPPPVPCVAPDNDTAGL